MLGSNIRAITRRKLMNDMVRKLLMIVTIMIAKLLSFSWVHPLLKTLPSLAYTVAGLRTETQRRGDSKL